jgi:hypothetical protein
LVASFVILLATAVIPESPKYFYANRKFEKARETLSLIGKYNRMPESAAVISQVKFDTEVANIPDLQNVQDNESTELEADANPNS